MEPLLLTGNEAVAWAARDSGVRVAASMAGAVSENLPIGEDALEEAIRRMAPAGTLERNRCAFRLGREAGA